MKWIAVVESSTRNIGRIGVCCSSMENLRSRMKGLAYNTLHVERYLRVEIDHARSKILADCSKDEPKGILKKSCDTDTDAATLDDPHRELSTKFSPKSGKRVSFADVSPEGSLVETFNFSPNDEDAKFLSSADYYQYRHRSSKPLKHTIEASKKKEAPNVALCFPDPTTRLNFRKSFERQNVALEKCGARDRTVTGIILINNIDFRKRVFIRYTVNSWSTFSDTDATYLPIKSSPPHLDRFMFTLHLPQRRRELEFCICFAVNSLEYWDNNEGRNYKVKDVHHTDDESINHLY